MKMLLMIVADTEAEAVMTKLVENEFRVTQVASTGGFLRRGNSTMMVGTEDHRVEEAIDLVRSACAPPEREGRRRATIFVLDVDEFKQL